MRTKALILLVITLFAGHLFGHCDTINGPVVAAAKAALEKGDITPVLKWIPSGSETEIRTAFRQALAARAQGEAARDIADRWFFETVVRVHRAGEGMPYTGLKSDLPEEVIVRADAAIGKGSVDDLANDLGKDVAAGVRTRFTRLMEAKQTANQSVEAGRRYVEAYIDFTHYIERIHQSEGAAHEH